MRSFLLVFVVLAMFFAGRHLYFRPDHARGDVAPDFQATLVDGSHFELGQLEGSYVLIHFWGSWCGPCRAENPSLATVYDQYREEQEPALRFEVVSIALDSDRARWLRAIEKDGLRWPRHIIETGQFSSPIASLYGVRQIPTNFLVNPSGQIVGVNLSPDAIDRFLSDKRIDNAY